MARSINQILETIRWIIYSERNDIIAIERINHFSDTYPTSEFVIKSGSVRKSLIKDINQN